MYLLLFLAKDGITVNMIEVQLIQIFTGIELHKMVGGTFFHHKN